MKRFEIESLSILDELRSRPGSRTFFLFASGYEERASHLARCLIDEPKLIEDSLSLVLGFREYSDTQVRTDNDRFFSKEFSSPRFVSAAGSEELLVELEKVIDLVVTCHQIVIDYSSMPRAWYSRLFEFFCLSEVPCDIIFCYSEGNYSEVVDYPTVGYDRVDLISGSSRINSSTETTILGLGLDYRRSFGIWHLLDPSRAGVALGYTENNFEIVDRVEKANFELVSWSEFSIILNLNKFSEIISRLVAVIRREMRRGDVVLVADGPKPLVMAFIIAPYIIAEAGCVCISVGSIKPQNFVPVNVRAAGRVVSHRIKTHIRSDD